MLDIDIKKSDYVVELVDTASKLKYGHVQERFFYITEVLFSEGITPFDEEIKTGLKDHALEYFIEVYRDIVYRRSLFNRLTIKINQS